MSIEIVEERVIELRKPLSHAKVDYAEIRLKEPTVGQLRQAYKAGTGLDMIAALISAVAGIPPQAVDKMTQRDMQECADFFDQFNGDSKPPESLPESGESEPS